MLLNAAPSLNTDLQEFYHMNLTAPPQFTDEYNINRWLWSNPNMADTFQNNAGDQCRAHAMQRCES